MSKAKNSMQLISAQDVCEKYFNISRKTLRRWQKVREMHLDAGRVEEADKVLPPAKRIPGSSKTFFLLDDLRDFIAKNKRA
ncbi:hypothetical protein CEW91_06740 [Idiomarina piscisalsi]|uniref:DNA-binding protein n=1 Tax=Idiomarina piscisalsi TaxID=1096243 RepID=A0ABN5APM6_9GAMM|nr:hypothetical protein [Idiomarina piscisalsi]ASG65851.1 hypothetical protein CEW91_06740 [Idiomarina piscisalsi]